MLFFFSVLLFPLSRRRRSARDRNSFPSISIFSPASGALMKNDSDARHYSSALSSVIGSFFPRARTHEKSNLSTTDIVFRPPRVRPSPPLRRPPAGKRPLCHHIYIHILPLSPPSTPAVPRVNPLRPPHRRHSREINWVVADGKEGDGYTGVDIQETR